MSGRDRYIARCASDKDPNWPFWYVELNGLNVMTTGYLLAGKFDTRAFCEEEAARLNAQHGREP